MKPFEEGEFYEMPQPLPKQQPFDFIEFERLDPFRARKPSRLMKLLQRYGFYVCSLLAMLAVCYGIYHYYANGGKKPPFVFVEVRAIDPSGHPVAGAKIDVGGISGVTDSFGEWRRYLRLPVGEDIVFKVVKRTSNQNLMAEKAVVVQPSANKNREAELKTNIQLNFANAAQSAKVRPQTAVPTAKETKSSHKREFDFSQLALSLKISGTRNLSASQMGEAKLLEGAVYKNLKGRLQQAGITISMTSPWRFTFNYLPTDKGGLVIGEVSYRVDGSEHAYSFLRNLMPSADEMAELLVSMIRSHSKRPYQVYQQGGDWHVMPPQTGTGFWALKGGQILTDGFGREFKVVAQVLPRAGAKLRLRTDGVSPCSGNEDTCTLYSTSIAEEPPVAGWQALKIRISGAVPKGSRVYVSGFLARQVAPNLWEYWGEPDTAANVTVVYRNQILGRDRIEDSRLHMPTMTLAKTNVALRP